MIEIRNQANAPHATGIMAPLTRAATHIGWCSGVLNNIEEDEISEDIRTQITEDLADAQEHFANDLEEKALVFLSDETLKAFHVVKEDLEALQKDLGEDKPAIIENIKNLAHNIAWVAARLEHGATGADVTHGSRL